jgi:hypothetical protein
MPFKVVNEKGLADYNFAPFNPWRLRCCRRFDLRPCARDWLTPRRCDHQEEFSLAMRTMSCSTRRSTRGSGKHVSYKAKSGGMTINPSPSPRIPNPGC